MSTNHFLIAKFKTIFIISMALIFPITSCNHVEENVKPEAITSPGTYEDVADAFSYAMGVYTSSANGRLDAVNGAPKSQAELEERMLKYLVDTKGAGYKTQYNQFKNSAYIKNLDAIFKSSTYTSGDAHLAALIQASKGSNNIKSALKDFVNRMESHLKKYDENKSVTKEQLTANFTKEIEAFKQKIADYVNLPKNEKEAVMSAISAQLAKGLSQFSTLSTEVSLAHEVLAAPGGRLTAVQKTWLGKFLVVAGNFVVNVVVMTAAAIIPGENNSQYDATIPILGGLITAGYFLFRPWDKQFWWS